MTLLARPSSQLSIRFLEKYFQLFIGKNYKSSDYFMSLNTTSHAYICIFSELTFLDFIFSCAAQFISLSIINGKSLTGPLPLLWLTISINFAKICLKTLLCRAGLVTPFRLTHNTTCWFHSSPDWWKCCRLRPSNQWEESSQPSSDRQLAL